MNLFNYVKPLRLLILLFPICVLGQEMLPGKKQAISVETGLYSISSSAASASGVGLVAGEYLRVINTKWAGSLAFSQFLSDPSNFSSNVYGFDLLAHWCWAPCRPYMKEGDPLKAIFYPKWSYIIQGGFSQRFLQLEERTTGVNGLRLGGEVQRMTQGTLAWYGRIFYSRMTNGEGDLNILGLTIGARWWFGE